MVKNRIPRDTGRIVADRKTTISGAGKGGKKENNSEKNRFIITSTKASLAINSQQKTNHLSEFN